MMFAVERKIKDLTATYMTREREIMKKETERFETCQVEESLAWKKNFALEVI